jgi:hypothetical protein
MPSMTLRYTEIYGNPQPPTPGVVPSAPRNLRANYDGPGNDIDIQWDAPADPGSPSQITSYTVRVNGVSVNVAGNVTNYRKFDIEPDTEYTITVTARNATGESPVSNEVKVTTPAPSAPPKVTITGAITAQEPRILEFNKVDADPVVTSYKATCTQSDGNIQTGTAAANKPAAVQITGTTPKLKGNFTIVAINSVGESPVSDVFTIVMDIPSAPPAATIANTDPSLIAINLPYAADSVEIIEQVNVKHRVKGTTDEVVESNITFTVGGEHEITGLTESTTYEIAVESKNRNGSSGYGPWVEATTTA